MDRESPPLIVGRGCWEKTSCFCFRQCHCSRGPLHASPALRPFGRTQFCAQNCVPQDWRSTALSRLKMILPEGKKMITRYERQPPNVTIIEIDDLQDKFGGVWGAHPDCPVQDWKNEVANGDARTGYWQWTAARLGLKDDLDTASTPLTHEQSTDMTAPAQQPMLIDGSTVAALRQACTAWDAAAHDMIGGGDAEHDAAAELADLVSTVLTAHECAPRHSSSPPEMMKTRALTVELEQAINEHRRIAAEIDDAYTSQEYNYASKLEEQQVSILHDIAAISADLIVRPEIWARPQSQISTITR